MVMKSIDKYGREGEDGGEGTLKKEVKHEI